MPNRSVPPIPGSSVRYWLLWVTTAGLAALASPARADEGIVTDRPDFVESSDVVGAGRIQLETGLSFERDEANGLKSRLRSTPTLLRIGVGERLELRVETDGFLNSRLENQSTGQTQTLHGFADTALGVKWHVADGDEEHGRPGMAWLAHVDMASGSSEFRGDGLRPSLRFVAEWDLPQGLSVGVMPGLMSDKDSQGKRFVSGILAVTMGKDLAEGWHGFVELAGQQLAAQSHGGKVLTFDTGLAWQFDPRMQLDVSMARGLNSNTPDWQWGLGFSVRF